MYVYIMYNKNNETVYIYIPSLRMRNLLIKYLDNELWGKIWER